MSGRSSRSRSLSRSKEERSEGWEIGSPRQVGIKLKRRRVPSPVCGLKRTKMDEASLKEVIASGLRDQMDQMQRMLDKSREETVQQVGDQLKPMEQQIVAVNDRCDRQEKNIVELGAEMAELKQTLKDEVRSELRSEFREISMVGYKAALALEVEKVARNVVVQGVQEGSKDTLNKINSLIYE